MFRTLEGEPVGDVITYSLKVLARTAGQGTKIYVGSDSQVHRKKISYAVCIVFRYGSRGCHVIARKWAERKRRGIPKKDLIEIRLNKEMAATMEVVQLLFDNGIHPFQADFDFNGDKKTESSGLVATAMGWAAGLGIPKPFKGATKPDELVAAKAAHQLCK